MIKVIRILVVICVGILSLTPLGCDTGSAYEDPDPVQPDSLQTDQLIGLTVTGWYPSLERDVFYSHADSGKYHSLTAELSRPIIAMGGVFSRDGKSVYFRLDRPEMPSMYQLASADILTGDVSFHRDKNASQEGHPLLPVYQTIEESPDGNFVGYSVGNLFDNPKSKTGIFDLLNETELSVFTPPNVVFGGWYPSGGFAGYDVRENTVLSYGVDGQLISTLLLPDSLFLGRGGEAWGFSSLKMHDDGERAVVSVVIAGDPIPAVVQQVAIVNLTSFEVTWISDDLEYWDGFPVWGPNDDVYFLRTQRGDYEFTNEARVVSRSAADGQIRDVLRPAEIGVRSISSVNVYWE